MKEHVCQLFLSDIRLFQSFCQTRDRYKHILQTLPLWKSSQFQKQAFSEEDKHLPDPSLERLKRAGNNAVSSQRMNFLCGTGDFRVKAYQRYLFTQSTALWLGRVH